MKYTVKIRLNGLDHNPWHRMGFKQNPFPQIAKAEYDVAMRMVNSLDADPILGPDDIRERLKGCSQELIDICIAKFEPGKRVTFYITFEDGRS